MEYIACYLKGTSDLGISFKPEISKSFECFADADYCRNWSRSFTKTDQSTAKSRSGWIISYAGCSIIWASKLQTHVATSTTMDEYIALSLAIRDVIPIIELMDELKDHGYDLISNEPIVFCMALIALVCGRIFGRRAISSVPELSSNALQYTMGLVLIKS